MILKPDELCPCQSKLMLKYCCLPDKPPLIEREQGYSSISMNSDLVDENGNKVIPFFGMKTNITMRKFQQLSAPILELFNTVPVEICCDNIHLKNLDDSLHACQYHKRQFLYRLRLLRNEELLLYRPVNGNVEIEMDDMPLRYEFEAYVSRLRVSLDVLAKFISSVIREKSIKTNGLLLKFLDKPQNQKKFFELHQIYKENEEWIKKLRNMRDAIQHDGFLPDFKSFSYDRGDASNPNVNGVSAYYVCFQYWKYLLNLIKAVLDSLFKLQHDS